MSFIELADKLLIRRSRMLEEVAILKYRFINDTGNADTLREIDELTEDVKTLNLLHDKVSNTQGDLIEMYDQSKKYLSVQVKFLKPISKIEIPTTKPNVKGKVKVKVKPKATIKPKDKKIKAAEEEIEEIEEIEEVVLKPTAKKIVFKKSQPIILIPGKKEKSKSALISEEEVVEEVTVSKILPIKPDKTPFHKDLLDLKKCIAIKSGKNPNGLKKEELLELFKELGIDGFTVKNTKVELCEKLNTYLNLNLKQKMPTTTSSNDDESSQLELSSDESIVTTSVANKEKSLPIKKAEKEVEDKVKVNVKVKVKGIVLKKPSGAKDITGLATLDEKPSFHSDLLDLTKCNANKSGKNPNGLKKEELLELANKLGIPDCTSKNTKAELCEKFNKFHKNTKSGSRLSVSLSSQEEESDDSIVTMPTTKSSAKSILKPSAKKLVKKPAKKMLSEEFIYDSESD